MPSYDLNTESINSFVEDAQIKLPRFQRKLTWTQEDNFKLCLSVFKGYPLGVIVLSTEGEDKYLLDGRQRRNALDEMRNPENIYDWAKSGIGFNVGDSESEVREQYWSFVDQYFGSEEWGDDEDENNAEEDDETNGEEGGTENDESSDEERIEDGGTETSQDTADTDQTEGRVEDENILQLLDIILTVHEKRGETSDFTKPFDFRDDVESLDYIKTRSSGSRYVDTDALIDWIDYKSGSRGTPNLEDFSQEDFYNWLMANRDPGEGENSQEDTIRRHIERKWDQILAALSALETLNATLSNRKLGYMAVRDVTANDEKKIFEIINSEGTELTSVEILSAKPAYNTEIENPNSELIDDINTLYQDEMGVEQENAVRWDRPATFYERLDMPTLLPTEGYGFERRVRIGFKLMSGYYLGGVSKNDFEKLSKEDINWGAVDLEQSLNTMEEKITQHSLISFWDDWGDPLIRKSSEAVTINYLLCMIKYWEEEEKPTSASATFTEFKNNAAILFDKMIYEYVTRLWAGSSDSKIASNLRNVSSSSSMFEPVSDENWESLLDDLIEDGQIEGQSQLLNANPTSSTKLLLRYYYILQNKRPSGRGTMSVDHIIPQSELEGMGNDDAERLTHHIANLAELPKDDNTEKGSKKLSAISDPWLKSQISEYTGIEEDDFDGYSDPSDIHELVERRGERIKEGILSGRQDMLPL